MAAELVRALAARRTRRRSRRRPGSAVATTRTKWILPSGRRRSVLAGLGPQPRPVRRSGGGRPAGAAPGRANSSKLTIDDTGLPGRPNTGTGARRRGHEAEGERLGRPDRHLHPAHVADAVEHHLDEVDVAHRHAARRQHGVARRRRPARSAAVMARLVVGDVAEVDRRRSRPRPRSASSVGRLLSRICPGRSGPVPTDQLVAGRQHADPRPGMGDHLVDPERRQHAQASRGQPRRPAEHDARRPAGRRRPPARGCRARPPPRCARRGRRRSRSVRSTMTTASAPVGHRRAGDDPHRLARAQRPVGGVTGGDLGHHAAGSTGAAATSAARTA